MRCTQAKEKDVSPIQLSSFEQNTQWAAMSLFVGIFDKHNNLMELDILKFRLTDKGKVNMP